MNYFKKIDFVLPDIDMSRIVGGKPIEGYGTTFLSYDILDNEYFYNIYSKKIKFKIPPDVVNYTEVTQNGTPLHVDLVKSAINYYIESQGCVTSFWKPIEQDYVPKIIMQQYPDGTFNPLDIYESHDMELVAHFKAEDHEAFALSTGSIHSVIKPHYNLTRKLFRWTWFNLEFDELLDNIEILTVDN